MLPFASYGTYRWHFPLKGRAAVRYLKVHVNQAQGSQGSEAQPECIGRLFTLLIRNPSCLPLPNTQIHRNEVLFSGNILLTCFCSSV